MSSQTRPFFHATTAELTAMGTKGALRELKYRAAKRTVEGRPTWRLEEAIIQCKAVRRARKVLRG